MVFKQALQNYEENVYDLNLDVPTIPYSISEEK